MKLHSIDSDRGALQKFLQDLICDAGSPQEVDVLVEALNSLRGSAGFGSEAELEQRQCRRGLNQRGQPRQESVGDRNVARGRNPMQRDAEQNHGEHRDPKTRDGYARERDQHHQ